MNIVNQIATIDFKGVWDTIRNAAGTVTGGVLVSGGRGALVAADRFRLGWWGMRLLRRWLPRVVTAGSFIGLVGLGLALWIGSSVDRANPALMIARRRAQRRGTRGRGRVIRRGRTFNPSSLRDEAVRLLAYTGRDLGTLRDVRRRLQETVRREGMYSAEGAYLSPDVLLPSDINRTV